MKKKTLITLLVVLLSLTIALTAFACGGKTPPPKKPGGDKPTDPKTSVEFKPIMNALLASADKTYNNIAAIDDAAYLAFTIYVEVASGEKAPTKLEITLKGNFDADPEKVANNKGFIEVKDTAKNKVMLAAYVQNSEVYIGEALTKPTLNWFKLSQATGTDFIKFFGKLPGLLKDGLKDVKMLQDSNGNTSIGNLNFGADEEGKNGIVVFSLIRPLGDTLFDSKVPEGFDKNKPETQNGDYNLRLKLDFLSDLIKSVPALVNLLGGLEDYLSVINMLLPTLLGLKLDIKPVLDAEGNPKLDKDGKPIKDVKLLEEGLAPDLGLEFTIANGAMTKLGIYYDKAAVKDDSKTADVDESSDAISIKFGVKNIVASNTVNTSSITPTYMPKLDTIGDGAIKLTAVLELGEKDLGPVTLTAFVKPDFTVDYDYTAEKFSFNFDGIQAFAYAAFDGKTADLAIKYDAAHDTLAFDLAGLYQLLGKSIPAGTVYYNANLSLYDLFKVDRPAAPSNEGDDPVDPVADSNNPIDKIVTNILGGDILKIITGSAGDALDILSAVFGVISNVTATDKDTNSATINIMSLLAELKALKLGDATDPLLDSEYLKQLFGDKYATHYLDVDNILAEIAAATGKTVEEIEDMVRDYSGINFEGDLSAYLAANNLTLTAQGFAGETATNGLGFALELKAGTKSIAKLSLKAQFVTYADIQDAGLGELKDYDFATPEGIDLDEGANWDAFVDIMWDMLDALRDYQAA